jgi:biopolymer transport protein TolR
MGISTGDGSRQTMLSEINVTPFVDVALVLLVIFMVTAPMIGRGVEVELPRTRAAVMEVDQSKLLLVINERREVFLGDQRIPHERLEVVLRTNERLRTEREVYLQADRDVPYGFVVHVMAILREAGVTSLGMVTDPLAREDDGEIVPATPVGSAPAPSASPARPEGGGSEEAAERPPSNAAEAPQP